MSVFFSLVMDQSLNVFVISSGHVELCMKRTTILLGSFDLISPSSLACVCIHLSDLHLSVHLKHFDLHCRAECCSPDGDRYGQCKRDCWISAGVCRNYWSDRDTGMSGDT